MAKLIFLLLAFLVLASLPIGALAEQEAGYVGDGARLGYDDYTNVNQAAALDYGYVGNGARLGYDDIGGQPTGSLEEILCPGGPVLIRGEGGYVLGPGAAFLGGEV